MLVGLIVGSISALGFRYLSPFLQDKFGFHDVCGVLNLHGIPGVCGGIISAIVASRGQSVFSNNFSKMYKSGRGANGNAGYQLAGLAVTMGIAFLTGLITGFITNKLRFFQGPRHGN